MIKCATGIKLTQQKLKPIKCPNCSRGRLCDAPATSRTQITSGVSGAGDSIFLKCPICSKTIGVNVKIFTDTVIDCLLQLSENQNPLLIVRKMEC